MRDKKALIPDKQPWWPSNHWQSSAPTNTTRDFAAGMAFAMRLPRLLT
jgi:hypothetical protein